MTVMPMFPLESVLFPAMPTALRIFEERYLVMLAHIGQQEVAEFGIVLIERGSEAGGGEQRFGIGTVAQITQMDSVERVVGLVARGTRRIEVTRWLADDPHPQAEVQDLPELVWSESLQPLRVEAERIVRRTLAQASEFSEQVWSAAVEVSDDPVEACWQLAGIAPVGPLDQLRLLRAETADELLRGIIDTTTGAAEAITAEWGDS